jgi:hypothetical protein
MWRYIIRVSKTKECLYNNMPMDESKSQSSAESGGEDALVRSAADSIEEVLGELEQDGPKDFAWAWERVGRSLKGIGRGKDEERIKAVLDQHRQTMDLWNTLNTRIYENNGDASVVSTEDFKRATQGYRALVADLRSL